MAAAKAAGAKRALVLPVSVPSHCALMRPAADRLAERLAAFDLQLPQVPVLHNVDVAAADSASRASGRACASNSTGRCAGWRRSRPWAPPGSRLVIESGPGKVLTGLNKRIDKTMTTLPVFDPETLAAALEATAHAQG